jgi:Protein of unknown function (DUF3108)
MKRLAILPLLFLWAAAVCAQKNVAKNGLPFAVGEELVYKGELSKLLGADVAELKFTVVQGPALMEGAPFTYRFTADAASNGTLTKLFRQTFRQHLDTTADAATMSALVTKKEDIQNKRERVSEAVFDYRAGKLIWTEHNAKDPNAPPRVVASALEAPAFDLVSVWYALRLRKSYAPGANFTLPVSDSGRVYQITVRVGERKTISTTLGKVRVVRLEPEIFGDDKLIGGKGKLTVWLTDDERHLPVKGEISSPLGKVNITLKSAKL